MDNVLEVFSLSNNVSAIQLVHWMTTACAFSIQLDGVAQRAFRAVKMLENDPGGGGGYIGAHIYVLNDSLVCICSM